MSKLRIRSHHDHDALFYQTHLENRLEEEILESLRNVIISKPERFEN